MIWTLLVACVGTTTPEEHAARREAQRAALKTQLGPAYDAPPAGLDKSDAAAGREVYRKSCAGCHGDALDGKGPRAGAMNPPPPALAGSGSGFYSPAAELHIIREGSPGTGMRAYRTSLSTEQQANVYAFIQQHRAPGAPKP